MKLKQITEDDAEQFLSLGRKLDQQSKFLALEPNERDWTVERQRELLRMFLSQPTNMIIVAYDDNLAVGYVGAQGGKFKRERHVVNLSIGVLRDYQRRGIGESLMRAIEDWATNQGVHRLELSTMTHNIVAQHLYEKLGFKVEGTRRHSLKVDGDYVDEIYMSKLVQLLVTAKEIKSCAQSKGYEFT